MLDINLIREKPEWVKEQIAKRNAEAPIDQILADDGRRREILTKHLLTDWRLGERWFARYLLDFELASNVGGWQWAAGCGTDAAPYFRIFNPDRQLQKFDTQLAYVAKWAPEYVQNPSACPKKIVEHTFARERALNFYKTGLAPKA